MHRLQCFIKSYKASKLFQITDMPLESRKRGQSTLAHKTLRLINQFWEFFIIRLSSDYVTK